MADTNIQKFSDDNNITEYNKISEKYNQALGLVDDVLLKNYVQNLTNLEIVPLDYDILTENRRMTTRIFKISEMVYEKDEFALDKLSSVFSAVSNMGGSVFIMIDSFADKTDFYMGVRIPKNHDFTVSSVVGVLENSLLGNFPGMKTSALGSKKVDEILSNINTKTFSSVTCIADNKRDAIVENQKFVQGLEKLVLSMKGKRYTGIILADALSLAELRETRKKYESIYTSLSPLANMQINYNSNLSTGTNESTTEGTSASHSTTESKTDTTGTTTSTSDTKSESTTKPGALSKGLGVAASVAGGVGVALAPFTGGISLAIGGAVAAGTSMVAQLTQSSKTNSNSTTSSSSSNFSSTSGTSDSNTEGSSFSNTSGTSFVEAKGQAITLNAHDKMIENLLNRIDKQLERLDECESLGMFECAAYFSSPDETSAQIAAIQYKSIMGGENTGLEVGVVNSWFNNKDGQIDKLNDYFTHFAHPVFKYQNNTEILQVTPVSLVSSNELAIHMGLPRHSVSGFSVVEHAEFAPEIIRFNENSNDDKSITLGKIYNFGQTSDIDVKLDLQSLSSHTFVTGSTGSGKSNAVYHLLEQVQKYDIPFLVIEPAKGEYKNVFGQDKNVNVFGTNPKISSLLKINPFSFDSNIHVLEHIDRLIETFNVCFSMYAAMPAVLKEAVEQSYVKCGWDLQTSENEVCDRLFPTFCDVLEQIDEVIKNSSYSHETKSDYEGALKTRIRSLTNGIYGKIFTQNELTNEILFEQNTIIDISRIGSSETKSLIMGFIVLKLSEYRTSVDNYMNKKLCHITVLEEAHHLLKNVSTTQVQESANIQGKSVEMLTNAIAEMRTYGEGFVIVDQAPSLLDSAAIRNTNTKIVLRLPEKKDREITGFSIGLNGNQINELFKLPTGVAAIYQNDFQQACLCKINEVKIDNKIYNFDKKFDVNEAKKDAVKIIKTLIKLDFSDDEFDKIKDIIITLNISANTRFYLIKHAKTKDKAFKLALTNLICSTFDCSKMWQNAFNESFMELEQVIEIVLINMKDEFCDFDKNEQKLLIHYICKLEHKKHPENKIIEMLSAGSKLMESNRKC